MKALTLKHPWPWAICVLSKRIENRGWRPYPSQLKEGERFAIHGGKVPTKRDDLEDIFDESSDLALTHREKLPGGDATLAEVFRFAGIVAVCRFGGVATESSDPWFEGPCGWVLNDLVVLPEPVPCKGAQGLWDVPADVLAKVREQYRLATKGVTS